MVLTYLFNESVSGLLSRGKHHARQRSPRSLVCAARRHRHAAQHAHGGTRHRPRRGALARRRLQRRGLLDLAGQRHRLGTRPVAGQDHRRRHVHPAPPAQRRSRYPGDRQRPGHPRRRVRRPGQLPAQPVAQRRHARPSAPSPPRPTARPSTSAASSPPSAGISVSRLARSIDVQTCKVLPFTPPQISLDRARPRREGQHPVHRWRLPVRRRHQRQRFAAVDATHRRPAALGRRHRRHRARRRRLPGRHQGRHRRRLLQRQRRLLPLHRGRRRHHRRQPEDLPGQLHPEHLGDQGDHQRRQRRPLLRRQRGHRRRRLRRPVRRLVGHAGPGLARHLPRRHPGALRLQEHALLRQPLARLPATTRFQDGKRNYIMAETTDTGTLLGWDPHANDGIGEDIGPRAITVATGKTTGKDFLWYGGEFTTDQRRHPSRASSGSAPTTSRSPRAVNPRRRGRPARARSRCAGGRRSTPTTAS